jgi:2,4-dienoyl-CoA reductase-like NADH-dependent reductase (Old Yellow Enzyme family)
MSLPPQRVQNAFSDPGPAGTAADGVQAARGDVPKPYPYEEAYFLPYARQFHAALRMPLVLLGGVNKREMIERAMGEGFEFVAMGRALLREPDLVNRLASGQASDSLCVHCNKCMATIYRGTRCVLVAERSGEGAAPRSFRC